MSVSQKSKGKEPMDEPKNIYNYLEEDPNIPSQQYFVLSYILPSEKNELKTPMIKFRGAYRTKEECEVRISKLRDTDEFFNMFIAEVGKWGCLLTDEQINNNSEIEKIYGNDKLNEIFKGIKDNEEKIKKAERDRVEEMRKKATEEGKKEFQEYIKFLNENITEVKFVQNMSADDFDEYKENIKNLESYLNYCKHVRTYLSAEYKKYLEIRESEEKLHELAKEITNDIKEYMK